MHARILLAYLTLFPEPHPREKLAALLAEALRESMGYALPDADRVNHERIISLIRTTLDDARFHAAWNQGRTMTMPQAIEWTRTIERLPVTPGG